MDNAQIEHELEDLEAKLERLRALYEQYFLGLEKLEPTVLRKDVDRKFWVIRREQIRNTGLRFKFQMLVQRYNTYQQYWTRVVREIENGTFRRDVIKVAQRFGEKDMMTIVGKKRAEQYKRLARNQEDRRSRRRGKLAEGADAKPPAQDEEIALGEQDIELVEDDHEDIELVDDVDDEASTLQHGAPGHDAKRLPPATTDVAHAKAHHEPDMEALLQLATVGVKEWSGRAAKPAHDNDPRSPSAIDVKRPPAIDVRIAAPVAATMPSPKMASAEAPAVPALPPTGFGEIAISTPAPSFGEIPISAAPLEPAKSAAIPSARASSPGVPSAAAAASKSRVAELAAQMRAKKEAAKVKVDALDLDNLLDPPNEKSEADKPKTSIAKPVIPAATSLSKPVIPGAASLSKPFAPTATSIAKPFVPAATSISKPFVPTAPSPISAAPPTPEPTTLPEGAVPPKAAPKADKTPIPSFPPTQHSGEPRQGASPFPRPASATSLPGVVATSAPRGAVSIAAPPTAPPKTVVSAGQTGAHAPPSAADLSEQKMREIYAKYVGAKRAANESTAGLTYDKLANSLRAQAEKLHASHPTRSVDFEVVTKDGKTALRPIVK